MADLFPSLTKDELLYVMQYTTVISGGQKGEHFPKAWEGGCNKLFMYHIRKFLSVVNESTNGLMEIFPDNCDCIWEHC